MTKGEFRERFSLQFFTFFLFLFWMALSHGGLGAEAQTWAQHIRAGERAFAYGSLDVAEKEFDAALDLAGTFGEDDPRLEESLRNCARIAEYQSKLDRAEPLYQLLLAAQEHRLGFSSPELLETLAAVARTAIPAGDHPVAMESLQRYVEIAEQLDDLSNPDQYRAILSTLARMEALGEEGDKALEYQQKATRLTLDDDQAETSDKVATLENLARMEFRFGNFGEGEKAIQQEAELLKNDGDTEASNGVLVAGAGTALDQGAYEEAARLIGQVPEEEMSRDQAMEAMKVRAEALLKVLRITSADLESLYAGGSETPEKKAAADALNKLLDGQKRLLPPDMVEIAGTLSHLVRISLLRGRLDDALRFQKELVALLRDQEGKQGSRSIGALEKELEILGLDSARIDEALAISSELVALGEEQWGEKSLELLPRLRSHYNLLLQAGEKRQARKLKKRIRKLQ